MKEIKILCNCNKCGKQAPIDNQMSNDNWTFYNAKDPCSCGGKFITCFVEEDNTPRLLRNLNEGGVKNDVIPRRCD